MRLFIALLVIAVIYVAQKRIFRKNWDKRLDVKLQFDKQYAECNEEACVIETINNAKMLPLPVIHIKFAVSRTFRFFDDENMVVTDLCHRNDAFSVMGYRRITRKIPFKTSARGYYEIEGANIIVRDFFMTATFAKNLEKDAGIYVFPEKTELSGFEIVFNRLIGELYARKSLYEDRFSFRGIRDYTRIDTMNHINWKKSARTGDLKVNLYNPSADEEVRIMINFDTDSMIKTDVLMEKSISIASSLSYRLIEKKIPVSVVSNGTDLITKEMERVEAGSGNSHMITIDKYLARISGSRENEEFFKLLNEEIKTGNDKISYIIISPYHKEDLLYILDKMRDKGISVNLIVPYYDMYGFRPEREYITGWEVEIYET